MDALTFKNRYVQLQGFAWIRVDAVIYPNMSHWEQTMELRSLCRNLKTKKPALLQAFNKVESAGKLSNQLNIIFNRMAAVKQLIDKFSFVYHCN